MIHSIQAPVSSRGAETRRKLLGTARELFHRQGYSPTSIGQILAVSGVSSSSMYHFFPSKKSLLVAVAEEYEALLWPTIMGPAFEASEEPIQRILAIFDVYRRFVEESDFELGCPVGGLAVEIGDSVPEAQVAIARTFRAWKGYVEECLAQGLPDSTPEERAELASFALTLVEGALVHARAERSLEPFSAAAGRLKRYLDLLATKRGAST